jgi:hypothetical protein
MLLVLLYLTMEVKLLFQDILLVLNSLQVHQVRTLCVLVFCHLHSGIREEDTLTFTYVTYVKKCDQIHSIRISHITTIILLFFSLLSPSPRHGGAGDLAITGGVGKFRGLIGEVDFAPGILEDGKIEVSFNCV